MATSESDIAAQLIERLLGDPAFRAEFRRDPASAPCSGSGMLGRFTLLRTSLTAPGTSARCGSTCSPNW